jgi:hypothetical protein
MSLSPEERTHRINQIRAMYNERLASIGFESPAPVAGERVGRYRRRAIQTFADSLLPQQHQRAQVDYLTLPFDAFKNFEPQVLDDCIAEARNPLNVPKGEMKMLQVRDPYSGRIVRHEWIGQDSFVKAMGRPGRRVISFTTDHGLVGHYDEQARARLP